MMFTGIGVEEHLVDQMVERFLGGHQEAEIGSELLPELPDERELRIGNIEQDRRSLEAVAEPPKLLHDERGALRVELGEAYPPDAVARVKRDIVGLGGCDDRRNTIHPERPDDVIGLG